MVGTMGTMGTTELCVFCVLGRDVVYIIYLGLEWEEVDR